MNYWGDLSNGIIAIYNPFLDDNIIKYAVIVIILVLSIVI